MSGSILQAGSYAYITTTIRPIKAFTRSEALGGWVEKKEVAYYLHWLARRTAQVRAFLLPRLSK